MPKGRKVDLRARFKNKFDVKEKSTEGVSCHSYRRSLTYEQPEREKQSLASNLFIDPSPTVLTTPPKSQAPELSALNLKT